MRVDEDFLKRYPELDSRLGDRYPAIRTTKEIMSGEEILLNSYGASYWIHNKKEDNARFYDIRCLYPSLKRKLVELDDPRSRKSKKRRLDKKS